jgi:hypothetical protein
MDESFIILGFPDAPDPDVVYLESQTASLYLEKSPEVERATGPCSTTWWPRLSTPRYP